MRLRDSSSLTNFQDESFSYPFHSRNYCILLLHLPYTLIGRRVTTPFGVRGVFTVLRKYYRRVEDFEQVHCTTNCRTTYKFGLQRWLPPNDYTYRTERLNGCDFLISKYTFRPKGRRDLFSLVQSIYTLVILILIVTRSQGTTTLGGRKTPPTRGPVPTRWR